MYLFDLLMLLPPGIDVTIKWAGGETPFNFKTGKRTTKKKLEHLSEVNRGGARVISVTPLWNTRVLYIYAY